MSNNSQHYFIPPSEIQLSADQIEEARVAFKLLDEDNTGDISKAEMLQSFRKFGTLHMPLVRFRNMPKCCLQ